MIYLNIKFTERLLQNKKHSRGIYFSLKSRSKREISVFPQPSTFNSLAILNFYQITVEDKEYSYPNRSVSFAVDDVIELN